MKRKVTKVAFCVISIFLLAACAELKDTGRSIGHNSRDVAKSIGHASRNVAKSVGKDTKKAVEKVKND